MTALLCLALALAVWLLSKPSGGLSARLRRALGRPSSSPRPGPEDRAKSLSASLVLRVSGARHGAEVVPLTVVVQQMAALLRGGRAPSRLWDELWLVYSADADRAADTAPALSSASVSMLAAARAAAARGLPVAQAIRTAASGVFPGPAVRGRFLGTRSGVGASRQAAMRERRIWGELAACFVIAEASGCPLADVLARLAAQLEVEDDAEAVRQTALAGPRATVTLLTWLPLLGLGLGAALGVDPLSILLGTPLGMAALGAGVALTIAGRIWSAKLVRSATGGP